MDNRPIAPRTGTTIAACKFDGGVVIGADGKISLGSYVCHYSSAKVAQLSDYIFLGRSGVAPDCQAISDYTSLYLRHNASESGEEPTVNQAARLIKTLNYENKDRLVGALVVAGWDKHSKGAVYACPIGGTLYEQDWAIDGSGSTYIWGWCDSAYKPNMTKQQAEEFITEALSLAMSTDGGSGGSIRLVTVTENKAEHKHIDHGSVQKYQDDISGTTAATAMAIS